MDGLVAFLRAALDRDEQVAMAAANLQFDPENGWGTDGEHTVTPHIGQIHDDEARQHIVRWDPARVLAEVKAKRAMIEHHEQDAEPFPCRTMKLLAQPYAGQDGWREEWRA